MNPSDGTHFLRLMEKIPHDNSSVLGVCGPAWCSIPSRTTQPVFADILNQLRQPLLDIREKVTPACQERPADRLYVSARHTLPAADQPGRKLSPRPILASGGAVRSRLSSYRVRRRRCPYRD